MSVSGVLIKILLYGICMAVLGRCNPSKRKEHCIDSNIKKQRASTYILAACLLISFASEHFFGVAGYHGEHVFWTVHLSSHGIKHEIYRKINRSFLLFFIDILLPA